MKKYFIIPMLFIILLFTGCTEKDISEINESAITKIYTDFDIEERTLVNNKEDIKNYINSNMSIENYNKFFDKNYEYYGLKDYHYNVNHYEKEVEYDFITKDLDIFFEFLKYNYGPYQYFGGEKVFLNAKNNILKEIDGKNISNKILGEIILKNLSFIDDGHFSINGNKTKDKHPTYTVKEYQFKKENNNYIDIETNRTIENIKELREYIKPSLDENGNPIFKLFSQNTDFVKNIKFDNGDIEKLNWDLIKTNPSIYKENLNYKEENNISILRFDEFYLAQNNALYPPAISKDKEYNFVLEKVESLMDNDFGIIDLRNNTGGSGTLIYEILNIINKDEHESIVISIVGIINDIFLNFYKNDSDKYEIIDNNIIYYGDNTPKKNDNIIFVLADEESSSASEGFLYETTTYKNILSVGIPTYGSLVNNFYESLSLPYSDIYFSYGNTLNIFDERYFKEFYGYQPDIWIEPQYAEERLLKYINNLQNK